MRGEIKSHKDLEVWKKSMKLVEDIYKITNSFPKEEMYGLTSQIRRSAVAIPTNIPEGHQRNHIKEYIQFLYIAKASGSELETLLTISANLQYINDNIRGTILNSLTEILKMLSSLISKLKLISINRTNSKTQHLRPKT